MIRLSVEHQFLRGIDSLATVGMTANLSGRAEGLLDGLSSLAHHTSTLGIILTLVASLLVVLSLVEAGSIQLLIARGTQGLVVMVAIVTSPNDIFAIHTLETELVVDLTESSEALCEQNGLTTSGANGIIRSSVNDNHFLLSLTVVSNLSTNEERTLELVQIGSISSDRQDTHAHLLEVLELEQIAHTEQIHLRATNLSGKSNETTHILSLEKGRSLTDLFVTNTLQSSHSLDGIGQNGVGKVAELHSVLKQLLELILIIGILLSHNLLHPLSSNLTRSGTL